MIYDGMYKRKAFTMTFIVATISIITIIGFANVAYTFTNLNLQYQSNNNSYKQCNHVLHMKKMFDNEIAPKYIIGSGYKVIPVNPATTDVLVSKCSLEPVVGISQ
jgi:hypothetical protein